MQPEFSDEDNRGPEIIASEDKLLVNSFNGDTPPPKGKSLAFRTGDRGKQVSVVIIKFGCYEISALLNLVLIELIYNTLGAIIGIELYGKWEDSGVAPITVILIALAVLILYVNGYAKIYPIQPCNDVNVSYIIERITDVLKGTMDAVIGGYVGTIIINNSSPVEVSVGFLILLIMAEIAKSTILIPHSVKMEKKNAESHVTGMFMTAAYSSASIMPSNGVQY